MAQRSNHYDVAFEEFLRWKQVPYIAVDEQRRSLLQEASLKSMDFIVSSSRGVNLLVDVKGRRFPSGSETSPHKWENWATADDIESLLQWQGVFGEGFRAILVFAYYLVDEQFLSDFDSLFEFRDSLYSFYGVWVDEYQEGMTTRSRSWDTVSLPSANFRELRLPLERFL